jgi:hypothetical protein
MLTPPSVTQTILLAPTLAGPALFSFFFLLLGAPPSGLEGGSSLALSLHHVAAGLSRRLPLVP